MSSAFSLAGRQRLAILWPHWQWFMTLRTLTTLTAAVPSIVLIIATTRGGGYIYGTISFTYVVLINLYNILVVLFASKIINPAQQALEAFVAVAGIAYPTYLYIVGADVVSHGRYGLSSAELCSAKDGYYYLSDTQKYKWQEDFDSLAACESAVRNPAMLLRAIAACACIAWVGSLFVFVWTSAGWARVKKLEKEAKKVETQSVPLAAV